MQRLLSTFILILITSTTALHAQGTADDYNRAYALQKKYSGRNCYYTNANPRWQQNSHTFWYIRNTADGDVLVTVDADRLQETVETDKGKIDARLKEERDRQQIGRAHV